MATKTGQCLCGAVRFSANEVSTEFGACHCEMCQRWSGGPFMATSAASVTFAGEENLTRYQSSGWAERGFCKICGANLFYRVKKLTAHEMCVGAFNERDELLLTSEIFIDRKPAAYAIAGDHKRLTEAETIAMYADYSG